MLEIKLGQVGQPGDEDYEPSCKLQFEHSLASVSKWESIHKKTFFNKDGKTREEMVSYIHQMLLTPNPPENYVNRLFVEHYQLFVEYIDDNRTATWFSEAQKDRASREVITSELLYYWMIEFNIPFSCDTWHFSRLMTLIRICVVKQTKPKKMSKNAIAEQYRTLNAQRRRELGTSG